MVSINLYTCWRSCVFHSSERGHKSYDLIRPYLTSFGYSVWPQSTFFDPGSATILQSWCDINIWIPWNEVQCLDTKVIDNSLCDKYNYVLWYCNVCSRSCSRTSRKFSTRNRNDLKVNAHMWNWTTQNTWNIRSAKVDVQSRVTKLNGLLVPFIFDFKFLIDKSHFRDSTSMHILYDARWLESCHLDWCISISFHVCWFYCNYFLWRYQ